MGAVRRLLAWPRGPVVVCGLVLSACGFEVPTSVTDAPPDMSNQPAAASCKALHTSNPGAMSGTYVIDPDGPGGGDPYSVTCDMVTAGGGWTVVFFPATNVASVPTSYTSATLPLLAAAQDVLIVYRDSAHAAVADNATFAMPAEWRTAPPFNYAMTDVTTPVSVNGAAAVPTLVRYGFQSFNDLCSDPWISSGGKWGRLCVAGTRAPYYSGFATAAADTCSNSLAAWDSTSCTADLRFSIAVR